MSYLKYGSKEWTDVNIKVFGSPNSPEQVFYGHTIEEIDLNYKKLCKPDSPETIKRKKQIEEESKLSRIALFKKLEAKTNWTRSNDRRDCNLPVIKSLKSYINQTYSDCQSRNLLADRIISKELSYANAIAISNFSSSKLRFIVYKRKHNGICNEKVGSPKILDKLSEEKLTVDFKNYLKNNKIIANFDSELSLQFKKEMRILINVEALSTFKRKQIFQQNKEFKEPSRRSVERYVTKLWTNLKEEEINTIETNFLDYDDW
jgi:hypothetical protein